MYQSMKNKIIKNTNALDNIFQVFMHMEKIMYYADVSIKKNVIR